MDLIKQFKELYHEMKESRDVANMRTFGEAAKKMYYKLAETHPELAEEMLEMLYPIRYHNYLSEDEAQHIVDGLVSQNGDTGAHWDRQTFEQVVTRLGGKVEDMPHYNNYALWVVANMIYSDHAESIAEDMGFSSIANVPNEKMAKSCYRKAVEKLTDPDRPRFVRAYFDVD
jgi:hypothetical protein